jgi:hypothetical protein
MEGGTTCYLTSATFDALWRGEMSCDAAITAGRLVVVGTSVHPRELAKALRELAGADGARILEKATIG